MTRAYLLLPASLVLACGSSSLTPSGNYQPQQPLAAATVADPCANHATQDSCTAAGSTCAWTPIVCPANADCPAAVCATVDPCAAHKDAQSCAAAATVDLRCTWTAISASGGTPALCPVGHDCSGGGYCWELPAAGGGCGCIQPLACPKDGSCPPVACDCPPPPSGTGGATGGGGTCTCNCPTCAPGEACPACACDCGPGTGGAGGTGAGGSAGTGGGGGTTCGTASGGSGSGTCTCACPACPAGAPCAPCSCSCGSSPTTTMTVSPTGTSTVSGGANSGATTPDPCSGYTDAKSCAADTADSCAWVQLGIACITTPCPTGTCVHMTPPPDGGSGGSGGCGCACPACPAGETCPPCSCNCCSSTGSTTGAGGADIGSTPTTPQPVTAHAH